MNENLKESSDFVRKRSEIVFVYDIKDANPNGDPDENKPRIDEETERNLVTDVRLKRTIRDYLKERGYEIFVKEEEGTDGGRKTREERLKDLNITTKEDAFRLVEKCIDLRLFGATIAGKGEKKGENVFTWIGPVQFKFGRSLHTVEPKLIRGTSVLPTKEQKAGGAFTEMWILPYSLICFYGIINENAAKYTNLTEKDIQLLMEGIWNGTKNLITRSKIGQVPRFLLRVVYKENHYHIGDLDRKIKLVDKNGKEVDNDGKNGKELRNIYEVKLEITQLLNSLADNKNRIEEIQYEVNNDVEFVVNGAVIKSNEIEKKLRDIAKVKRVQLENS